MKKLNYRKIITAGGSRDDYMHTLTSEAIKYLETIEDKHGETYLGNTEVILTINIEEVSND